MSEDPLLSMVMAAYSDEPCRICRRLITLDETRNIVFTGYTEVDGKTSRASHKACWQDIGPEGQATLRKTVEAETLRDMRAVLPESVE